MKKFKNIIAGLLILLSSSLFAQDIISVADLAANLKNDSYVVVWAGSNDDYKVHIPDALNIPHTLLYNNTPVKSLIKPAAEMAKILGQNGLSSDKTIVVYDEGSGKYSGRMYWILKYLGAPNVKVLDGNLKAWKAARKPITGTPTTVKPATFNAKVNASELVALAEVQKASESKSAVLVDVRAGDEYAGTATSELRKGHIPGAVNVDFASLMNDKGLLKSKDELKGIFSSKGITADKTIILYCETSVRAGIVYLALKSGLGYPNVKVYDGAYIEWQANASNKVSQ